MLDVKIVNELVLCHANVQDLNLVAVADEVHAVLPFFVHEVVRHEAGRAPADSVLAVPENIASDGGGQTIVQQLERPRAPSSTPIVGSGYGKNELLGPQVNAHIVFVLFTGISASISKMAPFCARHLCHLLKEFVRP